MWSAAEIHLTGRVGFIFLGISWGSLTWNPQWCRKTPFFPLFKARGPFLNDGLVLMGHWTLDTGEAAPAAAAVWNTKRSQYTAEADLREQNNLSVEQRDVLPELKLSCRRIISPSHLFVFGKKKKEKVEEIYRLKHVIETGESIKNQPPFEGFYIQTNSVRPLTKSSWAVRFQTGRSRFEQPQIRVDHLTASALLYSYCLLSDCSKGIFIHWLGHKVHALHQTLRIITSLLQLPSTPESLLVSFSRLFGFSLTSPLLKQKPWHLYSRLLVEPAGEAAPG